MAETKKPFVPMYDIEHLNEEQKAQYYRDACDFFGVPANLNLLAFINMNVGDTGRHEVLYAKKGATDIIRQNRGISTVSLEATKDLNIPGQVCFTARGRDKEGREEWAVGAANIDGLRGKALADAIMTAQTRATRRMTLQFVGGGLLDETEVTRDEVTTLINNVALDAIQHQPVVLPNDQPGKPVESSTWEPEPLPPVDEPTPAQQAAQAALKTVKPEVLATIADGPLGEFKNYPTMAELAKTLPPDNPLVQAAEAAIKEPPKQRKRKPANEVTLDAQVAGSSVVEHPADNRATVGSSPTPPTTPVPTQVNSAVPVQVNSATALPAQPVEPPKVEKLLSEEQEKEIRTRLGKYRNEILPGKPPVGGGMLPVEGFGGVEIQLRTFVSKFNPAKPSSKQWNYDDWKKLLDFFDDCVKNIGAEGLVKYMQQGIGLLPSKFPGQS